MTEGLFILTTIFVAYVVYAIIGEQRASSKAKAAPVNPQPQAAVAEQPKQQAAVAKEKPAAAKTVAPKTETAKSEAAKPSAPKAAASKTATAKAPAKSAASKSTAKPAAKPAATKEAPAPVAAAKGAGLKNPKTGEVATSYSNYRFTKRWIKEALVEEGLLEKVYAGNELNAEAEAKIKTAIARLETMDKYKA